MKRSLLGLTLLLAASQSLAQAPTPVNPPPSLINFQGRLAKPDGTPVPDATNYTVTLSLWDASTAGNMRWSQTFTNVAVHNGVFAALLNLGSGFTGVNTLDSTLNNNTYLQIQIGAATPLSPRQQLVSTAYALKAATVPDGSITPAKLSPAALSAAGGGAAGGDLTGSYPTPQIKTDSSLLNKVSGTLLAVAQNIATVDQTQPTVTATVTSSAWQTFTPSKTGTLLEIDVYSGTTGASIPATLSLYAGQGTGSAPLQTIPITINSTLGLQSFPITASVTAGTVYTWSIGSNNNLLFGYAGGNALPGGVSDLGTNFDYAFQTLMKSATGPTTQLNAFANLNMTGSNSIFLASGLLGIGTNTPTAPLEVNGNAKIDGKNYLQFGAGIAGQQTDAGKIGYDVFDANALDIVGAGTTATNRAVKIYAEGGTTLTGSLASGNVSISGNGNGVTFPDGTHQTTAPVFSGAPAGGDLTGSYPNPSLATLATSLPKVSGNLLSVASGGLRIADSGAIGLQFSGNSEASADTGIGHPGDGLLSFWTNNVEAARFSGGNFGLGATAPTEHMQIGDYSAATDNYLTIKSAGGNRFRNGFKLRSFNDNFGFNIENDERNVSNGLNIIRFPNTATGVSAIFIDKFSGNVGIGNNTAPANTLDVTGGITASGNINAPSGSVLSINAYMSGTVTTANLNVGSDTNNAVISVFRGGDTNTLQIYNNTPSHYPALYVESDGSNPYAGYFKGRLASSDKNFIIDHPLDPENKYLVHGCIESDERRNLYDGIADFDDNGMTVVQMPSWFQALNKDYRYQLTCIGGYAQIYIAAEMADNKFKIGGGHKGMKVSWQITGVRQDAYAKAHPLIVEEDKGSERGKYLNPLEHGLPDSRGGAMSSPKPAQAKTDPKAKADPNVKPTTAKVTSAQPDTTLQTENADLKKQIALLADAVRKLQEGQGK